MEKVYIIRAQELTSDGKTKSWNMPWGFSTYEKCLKYLEDLMNEDREYYLDGGWEECDLDGMLIWNKDPNDTWAKWDFFDEYTIYKIDVLEVK